jgi:ornithine cyclodeaminase
LRRAHTFVEFEPQTRVEGEIQQMNADYPVTELWQVVQNAVPGRRDASQITLFDSVGFAIEDFSALRYVYTKIQGTTFFETIDLIAEPDEPNDLYGMLQKAAA